jgi:putative ABC transport system permease protein
MTRTYSFHQRPLPADIWVMDPKVQFIDDVKPLQDTELFRCGHRPRRVAVPLYKGLLKAASRTQLPDRQPVGLDDATLIGGPPVMSRAASRIAPAGRDHRQRRGGVDAARQEAEGAGGKPIPLQVGDVLEINDRRAVVVGICGCCAPSVPARGLYDYSRATTFAPRERKLLSFVLVKAAGGVDPQELTGGSRGAPGLRPTRRRSSRT